MRIEKRGLEPFALFGGIDERDVVLAGGQAAHLIISVLVRPRRHDVARLRPPERAIDREDEHRVIGHRRAAIRCDRSRNLRLCVGEDEADILDGLAGTHVDRRIDHVAAAHDDRFQRPSARRTARPDEA